MVIWLRRSSHLEKVWLVSSKREDVATTTRENHGIKEGKVTKDEALKLALKFVEDSECGTADLEAHIREALAQPEQEPVAFASHGVVNWIADKQFQHEAHLYSAPQRTWVGLTRMELIKCGVLPFGMSYQLYEAIETKLKEKNT